MLRHYFLPDSLQKNSFEEFSRLPFVEFLSKQEQSRENARQFGGRKD